MGRLIQDVFPANELPYYFRGYGTSRILKRFRTDALIAELHSRGISVEDIFDQYYEMQAIADARNDAIFGNDEEGQHGGATLTVSDAELAGKAKLPDIPTNRQPF